MRFRTLSHIGAVVALATAMLSAQGRQTPPAVVGAGVPHILSVTVKYTGKSVIDATHPVLVFLFDTPDLGPTAQPIAMQRVIANNTVATFPVTKEKVAIVAVFDPTGAYAGGGPPPPGTPVGYYNPAPNATAPALIPVALKTAVTLTFDGSTKMR